MDDLDEKIKKTNWCKKFDFLLQYNSKDKTIWYYGDKIKAKELNEKFADAILKIIEGC